MWRANLLSKLFFRAFAYSAVTEVVLGTLILFTFVSGLGFLDPDALLHVLLLNGLSEHSFGGNDAGAADDGGDGTLLPRDSPSQVLSFRHADGRAAHFHFGLAWAF